MLSPEICNFQPANAFTSVNYDVGSEVVKSTIQENNCVHSVTIVYPEQLKDRCCENEILSQDSDFYLIQNCPLQELVSSDFISKFVDQGKVICLSIKSHCGTGSTLAITSDGWLILHIEGTVYHELGLQGVKKEKHYYEIKVDLAEIKQRSLSINKLKVSSLGPFDILISWKPYKKEICPSSLAKFFHDKKLGINVCLPKITNKSHTVKEIPSLLDVKPLEMVEWIGMLVHKADLEPAVSYTSTYSQPESATPVNAATVAVTRAEGFFTSDTVVCLYERLRRLVEAQDKNYWAALCLHSFNNTFWESDYITPKRLWYTDAISTIFIQKDGSTVCTVGQLYP